LSGHRTLISIGGGDGAQRDATDIGGDDGCSGTCGPHLCLSPMQVREEVATLRAHVRHTEALADVLHAADVLTMACDASYFVFERPMVDILEVSGLPAPRPLPSPLPHYLSSLHHHCRDAHPGRASHRLPRCPSSFLSSTSSSLRRRLPLALSIVVVSTAVLPTPLSPFQLHLWQARICSSQSSSAHSLCMHLQDCSFVPSPDAG